MYFFIYILFSALINTHILAVGSCFDVYSACMVIEVDDDWASLSFLVCQWFEPDQAQTVTISINHVNALERYDTSFVQLNVYVLSR